MVMNKVKQERKQFLIEQLQWCREKDAILEEIETKLYEMKEIAHFAANYALSQSEIEKLNNRIEELIGEIHSLECKLYTVVH